MDLGLQGFAGGDRRPHGPSRHRNGCLDELRQGRARDEEVLRIRGDAGRAPRGNDIPVPCPLRRVETTTRWKTPRRPADLERERLRGRRLDTLGRQRAGQHAACTEKRARGGGLVAWSTTGGRKKPRSGQSQGGSGAVTWLNPRPACRICAVCSIPEGAARLVGASPKTRGVRCSRGRTAPRGDKPRRGTPGAEPG
jgi:hypothetical protein